MTIAIMQPYVFPYLGYFQIVDAVDCFIFYDDVNFMKKSWVNRNRILVNGQDNLFTIPLQSSSQNNLIKDTYLDSDSKWKDKLLKTIEFSYKKAPFFKEVYPLIDNIILQEHKTISELAIQSVVDVSNYMGIKTRFKTTSETFDNIGLKGQDRILDICKKESADRYVNTIAGEHVYTKSVFTDEKIEFNFLIPRTVKYRQFNQLFIPHLSIIDVLMFNDKEFLNDALKQYDLD